MFTQRHIIQLHFLSFAYLCIRDHDETLLKHCSTLLKHQRLSFHKGQRILTPLQHQAILDYLGEPGE